MAQLIGNILLGLGLLVLIVLPPVFIANKVYKDGVFGRISLGGISGAAFLIAFEYFFLYGDPTTLLMLFTLLIDAAAVFLGWHLWRFHSRVLREHADRTVVGPRAFHLARREIRR